MTINFIPIPEVPNVTERGLWKLLFSLRDAVIKIRDAFNGSTYTWKIPYLLNSWQAYAITHPSARYCKDGFGRVQLSGTVAGGTPGATSVIFELPTGYRPSAKLEFAVISDTHPSQVTVTKDGEVIAAAGGGTWFSLDSVSFFAE